jgi:ABC-type polysaccharide/polyol phosphate transport system ATPase subunit
LPYEYDPRLAISCQHVSVTYRTTFEKIPTFKSAIVRLGRGERVVRLVPAVADVSFDVHHGTVLGIIGANGAGKSTLLRTLAGILPPTKGRVVINGKVSTLLSLGVGFDRRLSGRQNIELGGLAAGLSRQEVRERAKQIIAFAELPDGFIDMPMRTYSAGMSGRLAFSVAVHLEPDILLIDEALSAGDAKFKEKAAQKMAELCGQARTILLVSHGLGAILEMCNDVMWMDKGKLMLRGDPDTVADAYTNFLGVARTARSTMEDV